MLSGPSCSLIWRVAASALALGAVAAGLPKIENFRVATFAETTPLASNAQLIDRLFSPFAAADLIEKNRGVLDTFPIDPKQERFGLYVPSSQPSGGYGLLVWVSPLDGAGIPPAWPMTLDDKGVIFVMAAKSGNQTEPVGRRIPLALTAAANVVREYPIDPARIWISGFSGGSRIAERMALAYPDVFTGVILDGSSDPVGTADVPLPPRERFDLLLDRMAIVVSSGKKDAYNVRDARRFVASMERHCFDRLAVEVRRGEGHQVLNGASLASAIDFLDRPRDGMSDANRQCRDRLYAQVVRELDEAEAKSRGGLSAAKSIDRRYGHLAAPRSLALREGTRP